MIAVALLLIVSRPHCTKAIQGQMWPSAANYDKVELQKLARSGELEMCVSGWWGYKWEHLTIRLWLGSGSTHPLPPAR